MAQRSGTGNFDRVLTIVLVVAAVVVAATRIHSAFFARPTAYQSVGGPPEYKAEWEDLLPISHVVAGAEGSPLKLSVFVDLECGACARFHRTLDEVIAARGAQLEVSYVHFPLAIHRFATPAAIGAECASSQGKFVEWVSAIYAKQDSLGLKPWASYAHDATIQDSLMMETCVNNAAIPPRVEAGLELGGRMKVIGTPTLVLNGWMLNSVPSADELIAAIDRLMVGESPA